MKNILLSFLLLFVGANLAFSQEAAAEETGVDFGPLQPLKIVNETTTIELMVNFANDPAERSQGLMFVEDMPDSYGMLFDFEKNRTVSMWMKNTLIPLDMIFLDSKGKIVTIARNTRPGSLRSISSGVAVNAVLEVNAGLSRKWNLKRGDQVAHAMFGNLPLKTDVNQSKTSDFIDN